MLIHRRISAMMAASVLAATALAIAPVAVASNASAVTDGSPTLSDADTAFLQALDDEGLVIHDRAGAADVGRGVCADLDKGSTPNAEADDLLNSSKLTTREAGVVIAIAISTYCPNYKDLLGT